MHSTIWTLIANSAAHWYLQNRPRTWAIAYLVAIPIFGFYYLLVIRDNFYAPYAQYDPDLISDCSCVTNTMQAAVVRTYQSAFGAAVKEKSTPTAKYLRGYPSGCRTKHNLVVEASKEGSQILLQ